MLSVYSPFLGLIFAVSYSGKIWHQPAYRQFWMLGIFVLTVISMGLMNHTPAVWLNVADALISVGLSTFLFVLIIRQRLDISTALVVLFLYGLGYCFLRNWLFMPTLKTIAQELSPSMEMYLKRFSAVSVNKENLQWIQKTWLTYQPAIWGTMYISGGFFGLLLFNRVSPLKQQIKLIRLPFYIIYLLLAALALSIYPVTHVYGINLLFCLAMLYLVQGTGVLSFVWGDFFQKARMMRVLLIMAIIFNYPVLILIAFVGVLDVWFDYRKLTYVEEKHESNTD